MRVAYPARAPSRPHSQPPQKAIQRRQYVGDTSADIKRVSRQNNNSIAPTMNKADAHRKNACPSMSPWYTPFSRKQRKDLIPLLALPALTTPLTANIYFLLLPLLPQSLNTAAATISLAGCVMVAAGVAIL